MVVSIVLVILLLESPCSFVRWSVGDKISAAAATGVLDASGVLDVAGVLDASGVLDAAWAPEGCEGRSQAGPKGHQLEVGARKAP